MTITLDNTTVAPGKTFAHTVGNADFRYLFVQVNIASDTHQNTGVTYSGQPMSLLIRVQPVGGATVEMWGLANPPSGAANVVVSSFLDAGAAYSFAGGAVLTTPSTAQSNGNTSPATVQIQGVVGDFLISALVAGAGTPPGSSTAIWNDGGGDAAAYTASDGTLQSLTWTSVGGSWSLAGVVLHQDPIPLPSSGGPHLAAIRAGIVKILSTIPEIVRVEPYATPNMYANNMPAAAIFRGDIVAPSLHQADTQLGSFDATITWTIRVYENLSGIADAQAFDDIIAQRLLSAFDGNMLIDPNGPGVVDESRISFISPFMQEEDHPALWICEATLQTFVIFTP